MWTFDKHESLYDSNDTRFYPSPAWNRELTEGLVHYWTFDEEAGTTVFDQIGDEAGDHITVQELSENNRSVWGAKGRALLMDGSAINGIDMTITEANFTLSFWLKPKKHCKLSSWQSKLIYSLIISSLFLLDSDAGSE